LQQIRERFAGFYDANPKFITPEGRKAEMVNNFIKPGLNDLCVSRTTFDWGIPVKEAPGHVVYVWLDALTNYITALGYLQKDDSKFKKYWQDPECEIVHVIGADITRFHTIYWPMFLEAMGLREPNACFRPWPHDDEGWQDEQEQRQHRLCGTLSGPLWRRCRSLLFATEIIFGQDGRFTPEDFVKRINTDLPITWQPA
jgi:methionyl-tRNA synthetase